MGADTQGKLLFTFTASINYLVLHFILVFFFFI